MKLISEDVLDLATNIEEPLNNLVDRALILQQSQAEMKRAMRIMAKAVAENDMPLNLTPHEQQYIKSIFEKYNVFNTVQEDYVFEHSQQLPEGSK